MTTIKEIHTGFSQDSYYRLPYALAHLVCGHDVRMEYVNRAGSRHDPANWLLKPGQEVECAECARNERKIALIVEFCKTPEYSHMTLRDMTAGKTGEWMAFCVYAVDSTSPTQCRLAYTCEATPETERALRDAGVRFIPGPSRGRDAML